MAQKEGQAGDGLIGPLLLPVVNVMAHLCSRFIQRHNFVCPGDTDGTPWGIELPSPYLVEIGLHATR